MAKWKDKEKAYCEHCGNDDWWKQEVKEGRHFCLCCNQFMTKEEDAISKDSKS